jgi:hypothetical protein
VESAEYLILSKINRSLGYPWSCHGLDEQARTADIELIVDVEPCLILREHDKLGPVASKKSTNSPLMATKE